MIKSDIEIALTADKKPISEIASSINVDPESLIPYGHFIA